MRPPLNAIQEPVQNPKQELKVERSPTKVNKGKSFDHSLPLCTLDKHGIGVSMKQRLVHGDEGGSSLVQVKGGVGNGGVEDRFFGPRGIISLATMPHQHIIHFLGKSL